MLEKADTEIDATKDTEHRDILNTTEQDQRNIKARKRIDEILENKRLKALLDDEEDWEV